MNEQDRAYFESVVEAYHESGESIRETGIVMDLSRTKVRKILITMGELTSDITTAALPLLEQGKTQKEVAEILGVSVATLSTYLPYGNRVFDRDEKTDDAIRSKRYRTRQAIAAQGQVNRKDDEQDSREGSGSPGSPGSPGSSGSLDSDTNNKLLIRGGTDMDKELFLDDEIKVLKLRLELEADEDELETLKKYGKVKEGIVREFLVPSFYTLHALHYAIQKAFGWQNSHLRHFELPEEDFNKITEDSFLKYCMLCGLYFRFPYGEEIDGIYWDDDYTEGKSFKTWLKSKYTSPYTGGAFEENYMLAQVRAKRFWEENQTIKISPSFEAYMKGITEAKEVKLPAATCEEMSRVFDGGFGELIERASINHILGFDCGADSTCNSESIAEINRTAKELEDQFGTAYAELRRLLELYPKVVEAKEKEKRIANRKNSPVINQYVAMEEAERLEREFEGGMQKLFLETNAEMPPVCKELIYKYDYGDGWTVKITIVEEYVCGFQEGKKNRFYSSNGEPVDDTLNELIFHKCIEDGNPVCVAADGLPVMDDVGGVSGYCSFLKCIKTGKEDGLYEDPESSKEWARGMGWTGRMSRPENIL